MQRKEFERVCTLLELEGFAKVLKAYLPLQAVILLRGDVASGKTTLITKLAKEVGILENVTSPTFGIEHIYSNGLQNVFHYDFYQKSLQECLELGVLEGFEREGWHFVEWGGEDLEKILRQSGFEVVIITIEKKQNTRVYRVS